MSARKKTLVQRFSRIFKRFRPYYSYFDYYENLIDQISFDFLINKLSSKNINNINTSNEVSFFTFLFNTESSKIIKKIGTPRYKHKSHLIHGLNIFFYRKKLANQKITVVMHFLNEKLIMGSYILDLKNPVFIKQLEQQIFQKYLPHAVNGTSTIITDSKLNLIEINESVDYRINFVTGDNATLKVLKELKEKQTVAANEGINLAFDNFI